MASSPTALSTVKVTARSGPGCGSAASARGSRRVLRLMRENDLLAPGRVGQSRGPRNHDGPIIPDTIDTMWGTDMTTTWTAEGQVAVFVAIDHHNAECVGIHAARRGACGPGRPGLRASTILSIILGWLWAVVRPPASRGGSCWL